MKFSRTRLLALLLVAVFSFAAVGATTVASATDAATSAKKKAKKCKKGYKKVGKKCKKKKKAAAKPKAGATVSSVALRVTDSGVYVIEFAGEVVTKTPLTSVPVKVTATKGSFSVSADVTATGDGTSTTLTFAGKVRNPVSAPALRPIDKKKPVTLVALADGISSPTLNP
jgi:hypothetical protein